MEEEIEYISRTRKKKEADALQNLGLELAELSVSQLKRIDIPEELRGALIEGKAITSNVAGRRHRQFIGVLMRDVDPESIRMALGQAEVKPLPDAGPAEEIQEWVGRLLAAESDDIEDFLGRCPGLERQRLRQILRNINKEKPAKKPSKSRKLLEELILKALGLKLG